MLQQQLSGAGLHSALRQLALEPIGNYSSSVTSVNTRAEACAAVTAAAAGTARGSVGNNLLLQDALSPASSPSRQQSEGYVPAAGQLFMHSSSTGSQASRGLLRGTTAATADTAAAGGATANGSSSTAHRNVRKSVSFAELPSWRTSAATGAAGEAGQGAGAALHGSERTQRRASDSEVTVKGSKQRSSSGSDIAHSSNRRSSLVSWSLVADDGQPGTSGGKAHNASSSRLGLQSWRESLKAHRQQQAQEQQHQQQQQQMGADQQASSALGGVAAAGPVCALSSSSSGSLNLSSRLASTEVMSAAATGTGSLGSSRLQGSNFGKHSNSNEEIGDADLEDDGLEAAEQPAACFAGSGTGWTPRLSPVHEDPAGEQQSPPKAVRVAQTDGAPAATAAAATASRPGSGQHEAPETLGAGSSLPAVATDDGLQKEVLQLRSALSDAHLELENSRQVVALLTAEHPDAAQLMDAGAKQEQARQEVRHCRASLLTVMCWCAKGWQDTA